MALAHRGIARACLPQQVARPEATGLRCRPSGPSAAARTAPR